MNALDALMPTHALIHRAAHSAAPCEPPLPHGEGWAEGLPPKHSARIKYIILNQAGFPIAIFFHDTIQHSWAINRDQVAPKSAGFFHRAADGSIIIEPEGSNSLGLNPGPDDADIIESTLHLLGL